MSLSITFDLSEFRTRAKGTEHVMALGTRRAVQVALEAGAVHARSEHPHKRQSGRLTSAAELRGELRQADSTGAWGYLVNYTPYGAYVEYGTKAHKIYPKAAHGLIGPTRDGQTRRGRGTGAPRTFLRFSIGGRIIFARMVDHKGSKPYPFMQPAADYAGLVLVRETENYTFGLVAKLWD